MGLASAPGTFQTLMELILSCLSFEKALAYLDNPIIFCRTFEEHLERLELILCRLKEAGLNIKGSKCRLFQKKIHFFGHIVSNNGVKVDPENLNAVKDKKDRHNIK